MMMGLQVSDVALRSTGIVVAGAAVAGAGWAIYLARDLSALQSAGEQPLSYGQLVSVTMATLASVVLIAARPRNVIGWILLAFAFSGTAQDAAAVYAARAQVRPEEALPWESLAYSLGASLWVPAFSLLLLLLSAYPLGHLPAGGWRWINRAVVAGTVVVTAALGTISPRTAELLVWGEGPVVEMPALWSAVLLLVGCAPLVGGFALIVGGTVVRTWRAEEPERQQLLWLLVSVALLLSVSFVTPWAWLFPVALGLIPFAVAVGVLWFRLLGLELILRRTLVWAMLTALVLGTFAGASAVISAVVQGGSLAAVVAAAVVAALLTPVRDALQGVVDRLVSGAENPAPPSPNETGTEEVAAPGGALSAILAAVAAAVRTSHVSVVDLGGNVLAEEGDARTSAVTYPLTVTGMHVADLVICPAHSDGLQSSESRVVEALVVPIALVVRMQRINRVAKAARERSVEAVLVERDRIRRDLQDGLSSLSHVALALEEAGPHALSEPGRLRDLLQRLSSEVNRVAEGVQRIIRTLRPSNLELFGLLAALRERVAACGNESGRNLSIAVEESAPLPVLPSFTESTAYWIIDEALSSIVRCAHVTRCAIRLSANSLLTLEVEGRGDRQIGAAAYGDEIHRASMRQRAEELGGSLRITVGSSGANMIVQLPLSVY
ncbi:hypothetical protein ABZV77_08045 [Streptomyces sp. NPDC004732]|uniref:sensor histidine kinase n=1 Tax=Streptomyces sp. NPDC004732 TaxID=3154290 RepID=UPI0033BBC8D5